MTGPDTAPGTAPEVFRTAIRVSRVGKRGQAGGPRLISPEDQLRQGREYALRQGGVHDDPASLANADLDESGFTQAYTERPGIMRHLEDARAGRFRHLVFALTDRSSRQLADGILLAQEFEKVGVTVHYLDVGGTPDDDDYHDRRDLNLWLAQMFSRKLSKRMQRASWTRALRGLPHGRPPAWVAPDGAGGWTTDTPVAAAMRRLVELRLASTGFKRIAMTLNEEGHRPAEGGKWTGGRVAHYLQDAYLRRMRGDSPYTGRAKEAREAGTIWLPTVYPALITEEEYAALGRVNERLRTDHPPGFVLRAKSGRGAAAPKDTTYILSGLAFCARCTLAGSAGGRGYKLLASSDTIRDGRWRDATPYDLRHYRCYQQDRAAHGGQAGVTIAGPMLEDAVCRVVRAAVPLPTAPPPAGPAAPPAPPPKPADPDAPRTVKEADERLSRLLSLLVARRITDTEFDMAAAPLRRQREELRRAEEGEGDGPRGEDPAAAAPPSAPEVEWPEEGACLTDQLAAWRRILLGAVARVEAPYDGLPEGAVPLPGSQDGPYQRRRHSGAPRRCCRVVLTWETALGREFWAPLYRRSWQGERLVYFVPD